MEYKTGQIFKTYPPIEVINWCNETKHIIVKCEEGYKIIVPNNFIEENGVCRKKTLEEQLEAKEIAQEEYNEQLNADIILQIRAIEDTDTYRRKLLLVTIGEATDEDMAWLKSKEAEKQELRERLKNTT